MKNMESLEISINRDMIQILGKLLFVILMQIMILMKITISFRKNSTTTGKLMKQ